MATKAAAPKAPVIPPSVAAQNPLSQGLPTGLAADPAYLAFLRGAGYTFTNAAESNLAAIAAARAQYATAAQRLPEMLNQALQGTDQDAGDRGVFSSGARLVDENRDRVASEQQSQDLISSRASAIAQANSTLQQAIAQIARDRADAIGQLQDRQQQQSNQEKYIAALRQANQPSGGGGGGYTISVGGGGGPSGPAPAAPPGGGAPNAGAALIPQNATYARPGMTVNEYLASDPVAHYVYGLHGDGQANWLKFMQAQYQGADFQPLLANLAKINQNYSVGYGGGGRIS